MRTLFKYFPLLEKEGWREAPGWSVRPKHFAHLTTPSAPRFPRRIHPSFSRRGKLLRAMQGPEEDVLDLAVHLADVAGINIPSVMKFGDRDDGFCHGGVAACGADVAEGFLQHAACGAHVSDVADGNNVIGFEDSAHECPLDSFKGQTEIRHLRNQVVTFDAAEIDECYLVD